MMKTKRHYIKLTPGQREELIEQIQAGVDWDTLMANFRVSRSTIYFYKDKIYGKNPAGKVKKKYMRNRKSAKAVTAAAAKMGVWKVEEASGSNQEMVEEERPPSTESKPKPQDLVTHVARPSTSSATTEMDSKPLTDPQSPLRPQAPRAAALRANVEIRLDNEFMEDTPRKGKPGPKRGKRRRIAAPVVSTAPIPMSIIPITSPVPTPVSMPVTELIATPIATPLTIPITTSKRGGRRGKAIRGKALRGGGRGRGVRGGRGRGGGVGGVKIVSQDVLLNKSSSHINSSGVADMQFENITVGRTSPLNYVQNAGFSGSSDFPPVESQFETMTIDCSIPEPFVMENNRGSGNAHARDPLNSSFSPHSPKSSNQLHVQHNFHSRRVLEALVNDEAFVDVTLTAEGRTISAHKLVLSAMSPYFQRVLQANPCRHPVVIMPPSVSFTHLSHIISFMYKGETTVLESELRSLIRTAELLQVSGFRLPNQSPCSDDSPATSSSFSGFSNPQPPSVDDRVIRITEEREACEESFHPGTHNMSQHRTPINSTSTMRRTPAVVVTHAGQASMVAPSSLPSLNTPSHSNTYTLATPTTFFLNPSTNPIIINGRTGTIIPATSIPVIPRASPHARSFQHRFSSTPGRQQDGEGSRSGRVHSSPDSLSGEGTVLGVDLDIDIIKEEIPNEEEEGGSTVFVAEGAWSPPQSPLQSPPQPPQSPHRSPLQSPSQSPPPPSPPQSSPLPPLVQSPQTLCAAPCNQPEHPSKFPSSISQQTSSSLTHLSSTNTAQLTGGVTPAPYTTSSSVTVGSPTPSPTATATAVMTLPLAEITPSPMEVTPSTTATTTTIYSPTVITPTTPAAPLSVKEKSPPSSSEPMEIAPPTTSATTPPREVSPLITATTPPSEEFILPFSEAAEISPKKTTTTITPTPKVVTPPPQNLSLPNSTSLLNAYMSSAAASSVPQYSSFSVASPSVTSKVLPFDAFLPSMNSTSVTTSTATALPKITTPLLANTSRPPTATAPPPPLPTPATIPLSISSISKSVNTTVSPALMIKSLNPIASIASSPPTTVKSLTRTTSTASTTTSQPTGASSSNTPTPFPSFSVAPLVESDNMPLLSTSMGRSQESSAPLSHFPVSPPSVLTFHSSTRYPLLDLTTTRGNVTGSRKVSVASNKIMFGTAHTSSNIAPILSLQKIASATTTSGSCLNMSTPPTSSTAISTAMSPLSVPRLTSALPTVKLGTQSHQLTVKATTPLAHNSLLDLTTSRQNQSPPLPTTRPVIAHCTPSATTLGSASPCDNLSSSHSFKQYTGASLKTTTTYTSNPILTPSPATITPITSVSVHKSLSSVPSSSISTQNLQFGVSSPHNQNSPQIPITASRVVTPPVSYVSHSNNTTNRPEVESLTTTTAPTSTARTHNRFFEVTMESQLTVAAPAATLVDDDSAALSLTPSHYLDSHLSPVAVASDPDPVDWHSFQRSVTLYDLDSHAPVTPLPPRTQVSHDPVFDAPVTTHSMYHFPSTGPSSSATDNFSPIYYQPSGAGFENFSGSTYYNLDSSPSDVPPVTSPVNYDLPDLHPPVSSHLFYSHSLFPPTATPTLTQSTSPSLQSLVSGQCLYDQPRHTPTPSHSPFFPGITQNVNSPPTTSSSDTIVNHDPITFALKEWRK